MSVSSTKRPRAAGPDPRRDPEAFFLKHQRMIYQLAHQFARAMPPTNGYSFEDLVQEGVAQIWQYLPRYDPRKGRATTYFTYVLRHRYLKIQRKEWRTGEPLYRRTLQHGINGGIPEEELLRPELSCPPDQEAYVETVDRVEREGLRPPEETMTVTTRRPRRRPTGRRMPTRPTPTTTVKLHITFTRARRATD